MPMVRGVMLRMFRIGRHFQERGRFVSVVALDVDRAKHTKQQQHFCLG